MTHVLVTNDYPPKVGGIQTYLYELWRRLPADRFVVLAPKHPGAAEFDAAAPYRIERIDHQLLLPTHRLRGEVERQVREIGASLVVLDPALPVGHIGPKLTVPYGVVLHGAEVTVPGHLPGLRTLLKRVVQRASVVVAAGNYPAQQARRVVGEAMPETLILPPGVNAERYHPISAGERAEVRARHGIDLDADLVLCVSRLVPRKGMDVLIEAAARLRETHGHLAVVVVGQGRDEKRLTKLIRRLRAPVRLLGSLEETELCALYGSADIFAMLARDRWFGLEQEGFGIVYLEAAACGVPQLAGRSGGTPDAVAHGRTGLVVDRPADVVVVTDALRGLLGDSSLRKRLGDAGRERVVREHCYDDLAHRLDMTLASFGG